MSVPAAPMGLLAEMTHRCPLQCPYCSNPLNLDRVASELGTEDWSRVIGEAAALGVLQIHFSGGEPLIRRDMPELVRRAADAGLYSNIITSGVLLDDKMMRSLVDAGVDHIQLSFQDSDAAGNDMIGNYKGGFEKKKLAAVRIREAGLPLTLNFVVHRQNVERTADMIAMAEAMQAERVEIAHVQYYGWGLVNRGTLLPSREQLLAATAVVEAERVRLAGRMVIDYVVPDYHAVRPKACMGGWARRFMNISPSGRALPCHAAETLPGFDFPSVREHSLADIWNHSEAFARYRGTDWMPAPCKGCSNAEVDWGGCRCQAFALLGDAGATDPACSLSPHHAVMAAAVAESENTGRPFVYRRMGAAVPAAPPAELCEPAD